MYFNSLSFTTRLGKLLEMALVPGLVLSLFAAGPSLAQENYDQEATARLFESVKENNLAAVKINVAAGANLAAVNRRGVTAIDLAITEGYFKIVYYLLAYRDSRQSILPPGNGGLKKQNAAGQPAPAVAAAPTPAATSPFDPNARAPGSGLAIINDVHDRAPPPVGAGLETASGSVDEPVKRVAEPAVTVAAQEPATEPQADPPPRTDGWAVKKIERPLAAIRQKSNGGPQKHDEKQTSDSNKRRPVEPLKNIRLTLADGKGLGASPAKVGSAKFRKSCREKKSGMLVFCIVNLSWPKKIAALFAANTVLYMGTKTIVRYDEGVATYYHTLFPTKSFAAIIDYFTAKYGPPTQTTERSIAPLASPRMANPTVIWRSTAPLTGALTTLEIRTFDDARGGFPDTRRGAVLLYQRWSKPIFPYISTIELMMLSARGQN